MFRSASVLLMVALVCVVPYWCEAQSEAQLQEQRQAIEAQLLHTQQQATINQAINVASLHKDKPVAKPFLIFKPSGGGSANNFHVDTQLGLGANVFRSNDGRHSVGVSATRGQGFGNSNNFDVPPTYAGGIGYTFNFK